MTEREELERHARERWGDEWFIKTIMHADGDEHHRVNHTVERLADGVVIRDVARLEDGQFRVDRYVTDTTEYVAEVEA